MNETRILEANLHDRIKMTKNWLTFHKSTLISLITKVTNHDLIEKNKYNYHIIQLIMFFIVMFLSYSFRHLDSVKWITLKYWHPHCHVDSKHLIWFEIFRISSEKFSWVLRKIKLWMTTSLSSSIPTKHYLCNCEKKDLLQGKTKML